MSRNCLLEITVESVEAAAAAERGGADRIELCADLSVGGLTPSVAMMRDARSRISIPIFAMIRPRAGDFVYSSDEFAQMKQSIAAAKEARMDGVVFGILTPASRVDIQRTRDLVAAAEPLPVTFHRAFDETADMRQALEDVIQTGARRILTSGGGKSALEGAATLAKLAAAVGDRIVILPGAGIVAENAPRLLQETGAKEVHAGLSSVAGRDASVAKFEAEVKNLAENLDRANYAE